MTLELVSIEFKKQQQQQQKKTLLSNMTIWFII